MRLTEKVISELALEPGRKDKLVADDDVPGLYIRVTPGGRSFLVQATINGAKKRIPLGRHGALTLAAARAAARSRMGEVAQGRDPAAERKAKRLAVVAEREADRLTLEALLESWSELGLVKRRESYRREAVRALSVAFTPHLNRRADRLSRAAAVAVLDELAKQGKVAMASRTAAYGRALFNWAQKRGTLANNPFASLPGISGPEARDRVLTDGEITLVWRAAGTLGWPFGPIVRLLLLTGQRRDEVAGMAWSEVSADGAVWTIPKERAKNGKAHVVHLSPEARAVLAEVPRIKGQALVFSTNGKTAPSGFSKAVARLNTLIEAERAEAAAQAEEDAPAPLPGWRLHDFRRTLVSWLASTGTPPHIADKLLNHVGGAIQGVAAVYQRAEFLPERRAALERWAAHVLLCAEEREEADNVVQLHAGAGR